jgi:hypothetical protein
LVLLKQHILIAVDLIKAAKANDQAGQKGADQKWRQNADDISTFLSGANPNWPKALEADGLLDRHAAAPRRDDRSSRLTRSGGLATGQQKQASDGGRRDTSTEQCLTGHTLILCEIGVLRVIARLVHVACTFVLAHFHAS